MTTAWALAWMGFAFVSGDYALGWALREGPAVKRVAVAFCVAAACFAVPCITGYAATLVIDPIITYYSNI